jgi:Chromatin associated protein KTI12
MDVHLINEEVLGFSKAEYYKDPQQEKILRASLKSNVEKLIDQ